MRKMSECVHSGFLPDDVDKGSKSNQVRSIMINLLMMVGTAVMLLPFLWMLSASFKPEVDIFEYPIRWIPKRFTWEQHLQVWQKLNFGLYFFNSMKITILGVIVEVFTSALAAYGFARIKWPGRDKIFMLYITTLMIPYAVIMIPQYRLLNMFHLTNSHQGLIVLYAFTAFGTFLLRQYFILIPEEYSESARLDGAGEFRIFRQIILPLAGPGVAALVILRFVDIWNDFLGPLIYLTDQCLKTIPRALSDFRIDAQAQERYGLVMAGAVASLVPIVLIYVFCQRYIIEGIANTGIKG